MKEHWWKVLLFNVSRFFSFAFVICLVITVGILSFNEGMPLDVGLVTAGAKRTLIWVFVMTVIGCGIDALRRHLTVERYLNRVVDALDGISHGRFDQRLETAHIGLGSEAFREISVHINRLAEELSGVESLRSDFIASVSHEMKTPLAAVQNYASILRDPTLSPEMREEYTKVISQTTRRMADMVSNILKLNRLENQKIFPEVQVFDLGEQLAQCLLEFETVWETKNLELECDLAEDVQVSADPELLQMVWTNLFSNAMKFTPDGGGVSVSLTEKDGWATVCVADTGCGMSRETGVRIFEKFYQGDTAHVTKGNGLGLALVKRVVDITGGNISVRSTLGSGSTFTVQIRSVNHGAG